MKWFALNIGDLDTATSDLSNEELGIYIRLLMRYYATEQPLPANAQANANHLLRICRIFASTEQEALERVVTRFFERRGDYLHNPKADAEIAKSLEIRRKRAQAGQQGGSKRASKYQANAKQLLSKCSSTSQAIAKQMHTQPQPHLLGEVSPKTPLGAEPSKCLSKSQANASFVLPSWIPKDAWDAYLEMRRRIRKPMTQRAMELAVIELAKLRDQGHDPKAVLDQSTLHSWQGLFEVKGVAQQPAPAEDQLCHCGAAGVLKLGRQWLCREHAQRRATG